MNREIKFRALVNSSEEPGKPALVYQGTPDLETLQSFMYHWGDCDLMQYTGINAINGTNIFEEDIVKFNNHGERTGKVFFDQYECCYRIEVVNPYEGQRYQDLNKGRTYQIIGNIYENPNLLEDKGE